MRRIQWLVMWGLVCFAFVAVAAPSSESAREHVLASVTSDLCSAHVVFLGEPAEHGSAQTISFKSALVERLVDQCHFDTIIFESSMYDFLDYNRRLGAGQSVSRQMLLDSIGGIWSWVAQFQPLGTFLFEQSKDRRLTVYGMDDQLSATGEFQKGQLAPELTAYLAGERATDCKNILEKHIFWKYDQQHPYGVDDKKRMLGCLKAIQSKLPASAKMQRAMTGSLVRFISRDFEFDNDMTGLTRARDHSMLLNFQWLMSRMKPERKVIVWAATVHLARSRGVNSATHQPWTSFGWQVAHEMKIKPVTIGFSALSGTYGRHKPQTLPRAPSNALEAQAFASTTADIVYENKASLKRAGKIAARVFGSDFQTAEWDDLVDGLVIFRNDESVQLIEKH